MKYHVTIGSEEFEVDLQDGPDGLKGEIDGQTYTLDCREIEGDTKYSVLVEGESFNVSQHVSGSCSDLIVGGTLYPVEVLDEREKGAKALENGAGVKGRQVVQSVMPGIVRKVFVAEGDAVTPGTPLLILEAMKMENEMCSETEGTVTKVHVSEGDTVNSSDPMVTIE